MTGQHNDDRSMSERVEAMVLLEQRLLVMTRHMHTLLDQQHVGPAAPGHDLP